MTKRRGRPLAMAYASSTTVLVGLLVGLLAGPATFARAPSSTTKRNVELDWDPVEGATAYEVRVTRKETGARATTFRMQTSHWSANVKPGPYVMELRAFDERGAPGAWSPPSDLMVKVLAPDLLSPADGASLLARNARTEDVTFRWTGVASAAGYHVVVRAAPAPDQKPSGPIERDVTGTAVDIPLEVARAYAWTVTARDDAGRDGEPATGDHTFTLRGKKLDSPALSRPLSKYVDAIRWPAVPQAERYEVNLELYDRRKRTWSTVKGPAEVTTPEYPLDPARPAGRYRLGARALAANREASAPVRLSFDAAGGMSDASAMADARARDSIFRAGNYFGFANAQAGVADYEFASADANSLNRFDAPAAQVQIGLVYQDRESPWAADGRATISGLSVGGRSLRYGVIEVLGTYRFNAGPRGLLVAGAGVFYRQLPAIQGGPVDGLRTLEALGEPGVVTGLLYEHALNERWALRLDARVLVAVARPSLTTQVAGSATYRLGRSLTLTGGLVRRADRLNQDARGGPQSYAAPGGRNVIKLDSSNLNLGIEYGF